MEASESMRARLALRRDFTSSPYGEVAHIWTSRGIGARAANGPTPTNAVVALSQNRTRIIEMVMMLALLNIVCCVEPL
jgi:hypothetical protein